VLDHHQFNGAGHVGQHEAARGVQSGRAQRDNLWRTKFRLCMLTI
jgi:hypothetical protein